MRFLSFLSPKPTISDKDLATGLRWLALEGGFSMGFFSITTSGFLAAFALALGANNLHIGILAALPFATQVIQIPAIFLVEKVRKRKLIAVLSWFPAQLLWIPMALIPFFMDIPASGAVAWLLVLMGMRGVLSAFCNTAWNSWIRDLVPQSILGRFFSRRLTLATILGMIFSIGAAFFVDYWKTNVISQEVIMGYVIVLLFGAVFLGMASPIMMAKIPEPLMQPAPVPGPSLGSMLGAPFKDGNFRKLLMFLTLWGFASNLAIPFFSVYMLVWLEYPLAWVIGFSVLNQIFNIIFLKVWGKFVDRFGSKSVLSLCVSLLLLVILGWMFTTMPGQWALTIPLLFILHIFTGIATAGINITIGTIGLKLAPRGEATSYLASSSLAINIGAGLGPILGGFLADFFANRQLNLTLSWVSPDAYVEIPALSIMSYDFLFAIAFFLGLLTLSLLATVKEEGSVSREVVLESLVYPTRDVSRQSNAVSQYNVVTSAPFAFLRRIPIPGLDAVLGVTAYQIAEGARAAASAAAKGKRFARKLSQSLEHRLPTLWKAREVLDEHAVEITREVTRGAMHVVDEKPVPVDNLIKNVAEGVMEATSHAGIDPLESLRGASQGIIQGAVETGIDLSEATRKTLEAARHIAAKTGIPAEEAIFQAGEGILQAVEKIGPEAAAEVLEELPEEVITGHSVSDSKVVSTDADIHSGT